MKVLDSDVETHKIGAVSTIAAASVAIESTTGLFRRPETPFTTG